MSKIPAQELPPCTLEVCKKSLNRIQCDCPGGMDKGVKRLSAKKGRSAAEEIPEEFEGNPSVKRLSTKKGHNAAEEIPEEFENHSQLVDIADSDGEESVKKPPAAKRPRAAKNPSPPGGSGSDYNEDDDPFLYAIKVVNRKMNRAGKTYASLAEDTIKTPRTNWDGLDLPPEIQPRDLKFWHPNFCYKVRNLRIRRSKYLNNNGATHYVHLLKQNESYGNSEPQRLSFNATLIPHMIQILQDIKAEIDNYDKN